MAKNRIYFKHLVILLLYQPPDSILYWEPSTVILNQRFKEEKQVCERAYRVRRDVKNKGRLLFSLFSD